MPAAVILGSAFQKPQLGDTPLRPIEVLTDHGAVTLLRYGFGPAPGYVLFRHGLPHRHLPHHIPWRAHARALASVGCDRLLITSSVGVLTAELPLFVPLVVTDLLMPDNRLPDGSACTVFHPPSPGQGHLVIDGGLCDAQLSAQLRAWLPDSPRREVVFTYVGGPRTKTPAENRWWARQGAHVNSMTVGPELVMANELGIPTAVVGVGHKHSGPAAEAQPLDTTSIEGSLVASREALEALVARFLESSTPPTWGNRLFVFGDEEGAR